MSSHEKNCRSTHRRPTLSGWVVGVVLSAFIFSTGAVTSAEPPGASAAHRTLPQQALAREGTVTSAGERVRSGVILVKPRAGVAEQRLQQIFAGQGGVVKGTIEAIGVRELQVAPQAMEAVQRALSRRPEIAFAEFDQAMPPGAVPNDRFYGNAWHLQTIDAPLAWTMSKGAGIVVAVLDTGIDVNQPDLQGKLVSGWNATLDSDAINDVNGHGTRVAGSVAAATNNSIGVAAVGWDTMIMPIRITNNPDGWAYWSDMARGLTWAADNGAHVANMSYQSWRSSTVSSAARYLRDRGGLAFAAAGNDGNNDGSAANPDIIVVSATNSSDATTSWSNHGAYVDLAAPGEGIYTTNTGTGYWSGSGTSFASPVAAGVAALVMAANPQLLPAQVEHILYESAADLGATGWDPNYGWGRINAGNAVSMAWSEPVDSIAPEVLIASPTGGATVDEEVVVVIEATDDTGVTEVTLYADGQLVGTETSAPFDFFWDTTPLAEGTVNLYVEARDAAGNMGSHSVDVNVQRASTDDGKTDDSTTDDSTTDDSTTDDSTTDDSTTDDSTTDDSTTDDSTTDDSATDDSATDDSATDDSATDDDSNTQIQLSLNGASINEGRVWTAVVTLNGPGGAATVGDWDHGRNNVGGCTISSGTSCSFSLSGIRKNIGSVTYTDKVNGLSVTVGKP